MGYYTCHEMSIEEGPATYEQVYKKAIEIFGEESNFYHSISEEEGVFAGETKWYQHHDDMLQLSTLFPDTVIMIHGSGEDSEDIWYSYYKNGKSQTSRAIITFDPYDESKLEES